MKQKIIFLLLACISTLNWAQNNDSLIAELKKNISDTSKLKILSDLCWNYCASDLEKANNFALIQLELAQKISNQKYIAQANNDLGIIFLKKSKFNKALEYNKIALAIRLKLKSDLDVASSHSKISYCYHEMGNYLNSLDAALKALSIYVRLKNKIYEAYTLNNICSINCNLKNYTNLRKYAQQSYTIAIQFKDKRGEAIALNYFAAACNGEGKFDEAIKKQTLALKLFQEIGDSSAMSAAYNNIGLFYHLNSNYKEAIPNFILAINIAEKTHDINSEALDNNNIANTYLNLKEYTLCEKHLKKAQQLSSLQSLTDLLKMVYKSFGDLYSKTNRGEKAIQYFNRFTQLQDSLYSIETAKQFSEMNVKYETEKKENENKILLNENELKTMQLSKSFIIQLSLIIGIIMICVVFYLLNMRSKLKHRQFLDAELLKQQTLRSKAVIEAEEKERIRIARELHDGIGQQLSAAKLNLSGLQDSIKTNKPEEIIMIQNALDLLDESVKEVRAVSHNMVPNSLIKSGLVSAVREFISKISSSGNLKINLEIVGLNNRLENTVENILFRVLQEAVNNIIKHSKATEVSIQFIKHERELTILIEDNGVGFVLTEKLNEAEGIGLKNIQSRVAFLNGEVIFDSFPGKGTTLTIEVPL